MALTMSLATSYDAIVIGAGSNGLVAAAALGKAGRRVLVLERAASIGGKARVDEFAPGFHAASLGGEAGWVPPTVAHGIGLTKPARVTPDTAITVASGNREFLSISCDASRAAETIRRHSPSDAAKWGKFVSRVRNLSGFLEAMYELPAPDIDTRALGEILPLLGLARKFRALGRVEMTELLRVMPMSVQELLDDWFETGPLKAAVAAGGVRDIQQGPRSGGTAFVLLHHLVGAPAGSVRARGWWRDGPDAFARTVADIATGHGVTIRTAAAVTGISVRDDRVTGVVLASGEEIAAPLVLSTADPARTLLGLVDPVWLDPEFLHAVRNIKLRGCNAAVLYALESLPEFPGLTDGNAALAGTISLSPTLDGLERAFDAAKYGALSSAPHVEISVPSLRWPTLAPNGKHVLVARAQWAPYALRDSAGWDDATTTALGDRVTAAITAVAPGFGSCVSQRVVLSPRDIESRYGLTQGASTQGELTLDQIMFMRPVAGSGNYAMPIPGLYLGGSGTHPGPGILGGAGWLAARRVLSDIR